ncbi:MAG: hypothetical protein SGJ02_09840 [bacterium]|nr:hypothetical protein [bacterium]
MIATVHHPLNKKAEELLSNFLSFQCGKHWEDFIPQTSNSNCGFCMQCNKNVHKVHTKAEYNLHRTVGNCVYLTKLALMELTNLNMDTLPSFCEGGGGVPTKP